MRHYFTDVAEKTAEAAGSPWAFIISLLIVLIWGVTGPIFGFSDTWQLVINTGTTVVTFLVVFLIQNAQNRSNMAVQLKLDELIRGLKGPRTSMVDLESLTDEELDQLHEEFQRLRERISHGASEADVQREIEETDTELHEAKREIHQAEERKRKAS